MKPSDNITPTLKKHFDFPAFFNQEIDELNTAKYKLNKIVRLNQEPDSQFIESPAFQEELSPFLRLDINKIALQDKYESDSLWEDGVWQSIVYTVLDSSLNIKSIELHNQKNGLLIKSLTTKETAISKKEEYLEFEENRGYQIINRQEIIGGDTQVLKISGIFSN